MHTNTHTTILINLYICTRHVLVGAGRSLRRCRRRRRRRRHLRLVLLLRQRRWRLAPDGRQAPPAPEGRERRSGRRGSRRRPRPTRGCRRRRRRPSAPVSSGAKVHGLLWLREQRRHGVEREAEHPEGEGELPRRACGGGAAVPRALDDAGGAAVHVRGALHADGEAAEPVGVALAHGQRGVAAAALDGDASACNMQGTPRSCVADWYGLGGQRQEHALHCLLAFFFG